MVVILRSNDLETDPRVHKYINALELAEVDYLMVGWDREGKNIKKRNTLYYKKKTGYNLGKKAIFGRLLFNIFLLKTLIKNRAKYNVIHACDFDTVIPALVLGFFYGKKVIFDVFDWFSDTIKTGSKVVDYVIRYFERFAVRKADYVIICEEERRKQIGVQRRNIFVLPNIPALPKSFSFIKKDFDINNRKLVISYVGGFYPDRNLDLLLEVCSKNKNIILEIAGYGDSEIEKLAKSLSNNSNIIYHGRVKYEVGLEIMSRSDLIYAMYCKTNKNHIYAAPNKYYESLFLAVPIITTEGIFLADKVKKYDTGYVIGESREDLEKLFNSIRPDDLLRKSQNCKNLWESRYSNYVDDFMKNVYLPLVR